MCGLINKSRKLLSVCAVALCIGAVARAELVATAGCGQPTIERLPGPAVWPVATAVSAPGLPSSSDITPLAAVDWATGVGAADAPVANDSPAAPADSGATGAFTEVPPPPSSLAFGLVALAGLGAYEAGRSLRKAHLAHLPQWYHTGGPTQIGHSTPFDLEASRAALPPCVFEAPLAHVPRLIRFAAEAVVLIPLEYLPLAAAPRGPPLT